MVFTSHRWREIERLADRVTVFRNGTHVATRERLTENEAITLMTGRTLDATYPDISGIEVGENALTVTGLTSGRLSGLSFELHRGEILGVGGLAGQGQRDLFLTLFGARPASAGRLVIGGEPGASRSPAEPAPADGIPRSPDHGKASGAFAGVVTRKVRRTDGRRRVVVAGARGCRPGRDRLCPRGPQGRRTAAAVVDPRQHRPRHAGRRSRAGFIRRRVEKAEISGVAADLAIGAGRATSQAAGTLSGGNQQKTVMARWLLADADVYLLYDVTRGVDAATKHDIYHLIAYRARMCTYPRFPTFPFVIIRNSGAQGLSIAPG